MVKGDRFFQILSNFSGTLRRNCPKIGSSKHNPTSRVAWRWNFQVLTRTCGYGLKQQLVNFSIVCCHVFGQKRLKVAWLIPFEKCILMRSLLIACQRNLHEVWIRLFSASCYIKPKNGLQIFEFLWTIRDQLEIRHQNKVPKQSFCHRTDKNLTSSEKSGDSKKLTRKNLREGKNNLKNTHKGDDEFVDTSKSLHQIKFSVTDVKTIIFTCICLVLPILQNPYASCSLVISTLQRSFMPTLPRVGLILGSDKNWGKQFCSSLLKSLTMFEP